MDVAPDPRERTGHSSPPPPSPDLSTLPPPPPPASATGNAVDGLLAGPIVSGGARFLIAFGGAFLLLYGFILLAAGSTLDAFGGSSGLTVIALLVCATAIAAMYTAFSSWAQGQRLCAGVSALTLISLLAVGADGAWLIAWGFSGGMIGLGAFVASRQPSERVRAGVSP